MIGFSPVCNSLCKFKLIRNTIFFPNSGQSIWRCGFSDHLSDTIWCHTDCNNLSFHSDTFRGQAFSRYDVWKRFERAHRIPQRHIPGEAFSQGRAWSWIFFSDVFISATKHPTMLKRMTNESYFKWLSCEYEFPKKLQFAVCWNTVGLLTSLKVTD